MDAWPARSLWSRPLTRGAAGLMRGAGLGPVDRRRQRATPPPPLAVVHWTRYWRTTPPATPPRARTTPAVARPPRRRTAAQPTVGQFSSPWTPTPSVAVPSHTGSSLAATRGVKKPPTKSSVDNTAAQSGAGYFGASWTRTSTVAVANFTATRDFDGKKQAGKSTGDVGVLAADTSDPGDVTGTDGGGHTADVSSSMTSHPSTISNHSTASSRRVHITTTSDQHECDDATSLAADSPTSRWSDVTALTSRRDVAAVTSGHTATTSGSRDDHWSGVGGDVKAHVAEDENGEVITTSTRPGEMMTMTYLNDDCSGADTRAQVHGGRATHSTRPVNDTVWAASDLVPSWSTGKMSGEDVAVLGGSSVVIEPQ